jgi:uncharacterized protein YeeX (DUF496 family)
MASIDQEKKALLVEQKILENQAKLSSIESEDRKNQRQEKIDSLSTQIAEKQQQYDLLKNERDLLRQQVNMDQMLAGVDELTSFYQSLADQG